MLNFKINKKSLLSNNTPLKVIIDFNLMKKKNKLCSLRQTFKVRLDFLSDF